MSKTDPAVRTYRNAVHSDLNSARVAVQQTDLCIYSDIPVDTAAAREELIEQRGYLEAYIVRHPEFLHALEPLADDPLAPAVARQMLLAGRIADVGPMAAVAGALAEKVGRRLLGSAGEVIVENGGDIFIQVKRPVTIGIYAGDSVLSLKLGLRLEPQSGICAVCTSSGTVGHSLSFGKADAVCVLSDSCALADAAATAIANRVGGVKDLRPAIGWAERIKGLSGILIIKKDQMAAWGKIEIVPLQVLKKG
jgi:uncharacterized protein